MVYHFKYVDSAGWKSWFEMLRAAGLLSYFSNNCSPSLISNFTAFSSTLPKGFSSFNGLLYNFTSSLFVFLLKLFFFFFCQTVAQQPQLCAERTELIICAREYHPIPLKEDTDRGSGSEELWLHHVVSFLFMHLAFSTQHATKLQANYLAD